jgi:hypothetical protein
MVRVRIRDHHARFARGGEKARRIGDHGGEAQPGFGAAVDMAVEKVEQQQRGALAIQARGAHLALPHTISL